MKIVFATNNQNKLKEISSILPDSFTLKGLSDIGFSGDIPEDKLTIEENAIQKARYIYDRYQQNCFADDTGLEIEALNNEPGVFSARYALLDNPNIAKDDIAKENIKKVLKNLNGIKNRKARFKTVICLIIENKEYLFEGIVNGEIIETERGHDGFGYDPVFIPNEYNETFAEMDLSLKNKISHRGKAVKKLIDFLKLKV